jgi:uncharacterized protein (DUF1800 family)
LIFLEITVSLSGTFLVMRSSEQQIVQTGGTMKPYQPKNYSFEDAAHLLRRAGFGGTAEEIKKLQSLGPELAVEQLLAFSDNDQTQNNPHDIEKTLKDALEANGGKVGGAQGAAVLTLQGWWLHKMLNTNQPLKEKLALFWHGHFATGLDKVRNAFALQRQNELFRRLGAGKFDVLTLQVAKDPAMLRYLDNDENIKAHPNENFARELMELFTMGVHGGYSEKDVQESARAFTGWTFKGGGNKDVQGYKNIQFMFIPKNHDTGTKTFLGQSSNFDGADIVHIVTHHPSSAKFMTEKIWRYFVSEELPENIHNDLIQVWTESKLDIRELLRSIFTSQEFYAPQNRNNLIKSPLEYVIGSLRALKAKLLLEQELTLVNLLANQAQIPFYPPNVKGWDGGLDWIADTTLLNRIQFMGTISGGKLAMRPRIKKDSEKIPPQPIAGLTFPLGSSTKQTIDLIGKTFLGEQPTGVLRKALETFAKGRNTADVAKGLVYIVLISPHFHLA